MYCSNVRMFDSVRIFVHVYVHVYECQSQLLGLSRRARKRDFSSSVGKAREVAIDINVYVCQFVCLYMYTCTCKNVFNCKCIC